MISLYYGAKLQHWLVHDQAVQQEASEWQNPEWRDLKSGKIPAEPEDMDANPYRRYCRDHNLPLGTEIPPINERSFKCWSSKSASFAIYPLKYAASAIESTIRLIASLLLAGIACVGDANAKKNLAPIKASLLPPSKNFFNIFGAIGQTIVYGLTALGRSYSNDLTVCNADANYRKEIDELEGTYIPLWKIYVLSVYSRAET